MGTRETLHRHLTANYLEKTGRRDRWTPHRAKAWDHFLTLGLPYAKSEDYKYVSLRKIYEKSWSSPMTSEPRTISIDPYILPECYDAVLVFLNGRFSPRLSRTEALGNAMVLLPLSEAIQTYGTFLHNQWLRSLQGESDPFVSLNGALYEEGLFLYVPPQKKVERPVQILQLMTEEGRETLFHPRIQGYLGRGASLSLYQTTQAEEASLFHNGVSLFSLDENASLSYLTWEERAPKTLTQGLRAHLKRDARLHATHLTRGGRSLRHDDAFFLEGENAEATIQTLALVAESDEAHHFVRMEHQAPCCRSHQLCKNILKDSARTSFSGKIYVHKEAQKTEAYQLNNNIVLSPHAQAYSKPNLEIFADDVKASHGATVGGFDAEALLYMRTKGIPSTMATRLLLRGAVQEILTSLPLASLQNKVLESMETFGSNEKKD